MAGGSRMIVETSDGPVDCWRVLASGNRTSLPHSDTFVSRRCLRGCRSAHRLFLASRVEARRAVWPRLCPRAGGEDILRSLRQSGLNAAHNVLALPVAAGARDGRELLYPAPTGNSGSAALRRRWGTFDPENEASKPRAVSVSSISSILDPASSPVSDSSRSTSRATSSRCCTVSLKCSTPDIARRSLSRCTGTPHLQWARGLPRAVAHTVSLRTDSSPGARPTGPCSTAPVEPIHDTELRSLESKFFELLLSPLPLIDDGASAARSAVLGAG